MKKDKTPVWVQEREALRIREHETLEVIGKMGADGVTNGKLPNGNDYLWKKRRK